ncbi:hypothetical protein A2331_04515 [Candidatus Falkowbacteria bacterium RIFOXYB2_FULL_34_18]|uniref:NTP pyrophosphohydrolase MazG-like domain-containing protein n=1 Tax=Candidatus Falkowbacteria bacterium RIFOXYD2_FULL_34_120 TaxID=1798007 RepID=A0A1F5TM75_9BACT|nr:MAG: hypothetical protein A2331_04515 [Candidatus Falkowbacteria bacterium RIFOXYB2_FULL_34_18]OGF30297.1 MAG: hypothetical protein A2500_06895 [Candidatus Falkowbacteria bacterium RIFOXYC12_FULL_34_55]OGF37848.1 MAG: hypothetical protein A2466_04020 [Candidatus Falkowbacteria bacterium RIFOXYC2_FULL_34_220]OGF39609.1 MAG: hypothetical protein A2515_03735 [Candidatus Falkowbacteria bacterium RIFOXYD12_FULL_34_57]OGF40033.1 MAG: hypothetical protein A2531_07465 [Candidatus Falkowbacteria bact
MDKNLQKFIDEQEKKLVDCLHSDDTEKEILLSWMAKLTEEVGELSDEILLYSGYQRKEKRDAKKQDALGGELADVIIVTLLLAKRTNIDIQKALADKIKKINKRKYVRK